MLQVSVTKTALRPQMNRQQRFQDMFRFHEDIREKRVAA